MLDNGYHVPPGYAGRVCPGMGPGTDPVTHQKPRPVVPEPVPTNAGLPKLEILSSEADGHASHAAITKMYSTSDCRYNYYEQKKIDPSLNPSIL